VAGSIIPSVSSALSSVLPQNPTREKTKVLAFDAFPIFDPRPVFALAEELYPGKGQELSNIWRIKQFDYQWLRVLSDQYRDFWTVTKDALIFACKTVKVEWSEEKSAKLMNAWLNMKTWPDVRPALLTAKETGIQLVFLSNMTEKMLRTNIKNNDLDELFSHVISTDAIHSYKPDPKAYRLAMDQLKLKKSEIGFVAFAGWDAAGAKSFGYPTFWINRQQQEMEELGVAPDWTGHNLEELVSYIKSRD